MKKQKGFTLVELLVVIAIIGILAAILLPSLGGAKTRALRAKAQSTITQLAQAIKAYQMDWGVYIPDGHADANNVGPWINPNIYESRTLIAYLDGDTDTLTTVPNAQGGNLSVQYYEFSPKEIGRYKNTDTNDYDPYRPGTDTTDLILVDPFGSIYKYHNFANQTTKVPTKRFNNDHPMHPDYTAINFRGFQLYTQANFPGQPYGDLDASIDTFKWITNYSN